LASQQLKQVLEKICSKFNVIGIGKDFDVKILADLVSIGTQKGVISSNVDEAFTKILEKFEQTPAVKLFIPG